MKSNLHNHLIGIFKILRNRFDYINQSIGHSLTKGEENEEEIKKLLIDFLPSQYGIGSGVIVDTKGNESKQIDIIIYDRNIPNYTLSKESKLFLVDQVLATIEIKTTFNKKSLDEALQNTESIKKLVPSQKTWVEPISKIEDDVHQSWMLNIFNPSLPISFVFFYRAADRETSIDLDSIIRTMKEKICGYDIIFQPDLIFSLGHGLFFKHEDLAKTKNGKYFQCFVKLTEDKNKDLTIDTCDDTIAVCDFGENYFDDEVYIDGKNICNRKGKIKILALEGENINLTPNIYKTAKLDGKTFLIDHFRGFINFIYQIDFFLKIKRTNKNGFIDNYFPERFFYLSEYKK